MTYECFAPESRSIAGRLERRPGDPALRHRRETACRLRPDWMSCYMSFTVSGL